MADLATVGCTTSSVTLLALAALGQKADQSKKTACLTSGKRETTSETTNEKVDDRVATVKAQKVNEKVYKQYASRLSEELQEVFEFIGRPKSICC